MAPRSDHLLQHIRRLTAGASASSDAELLQHYVQSRDADSFAALVQRHGAMVQGVCHRILGHAQDAEDASQATFLVLARKAASVQPPHALAAWLYGVARRVALKARWAKVRRRRVLLAPQIQAVDPRSSPLDDLSARELLVIFDEELQRLPRVYRLPLLLCCVEGRSQEEAAQQLGWTPGSVKGRLERGRVKLHARLRRRGLTLAAALAVMESARAAAMVRPSFCFTAGQQPTGAAQTLADAVLRRMAWSRAFVWVGVLSTACVCISAGVFAFHKIANPPSANNEQAADPPERAHKPVDGDAHAPTMLARMAHDRPVIDVALGADGRHVISRAGMDVFAWETPSAKLLRRSPLLPKGHEYLVPLLPGGYNLTGVRTSDPTRGRFWLRDVATGEEVMRFEGRPDVGPPTAIAAPGGRYVAVRGRAGEICVLDVPKRRCVFRLDPAVAASGLEMSSDGDTLLWYVRKEKTIEIHVHRQSTKKKFVLGDLPAEDRLLWNLDKYRSLSPDGRWLVLPTEQGRLRRWDLTTGKEATPLPDALRTAWGLTWSPDGRLLAINGSASAPNVIDREATRDVRVWDVTAGTRLIQLTWPDRGGTHILFSQDGRTLLTTDLQGVTHLWEVATGKERGQLKGHNAGEIGALALRADDRLLVSGGYDTQVLVWDLTGRLADGQWQTIHLSQEQQRSAWQALASDDARAAYEALWQLTADPEGTVTLLRNEVRPIPRVEAAQAAKLIADLDSENFAARQRAEKELTALAETVVGDLRKVLNNKPSLEMRQRVKALLEKLEGLPSGRALQALRAVEVLEHIDTPPARLLLDELAKGAPDARLTSEAQASLKRLEAKERK